MSAPRPGTLSCRALIAARARTGGPGAGSRTLITECSGQPPLLPRITAHGVHLAGGAAGPIGGDTLESEVDIGANAELRISSVAATFARPAGRPAPSLSRVVARVGPAGKLWWTPQPLVMLAGSQHRSEVSIKLDATAELLWLEVAVLGRHGEPGGILISRRSLDIAGQPVNRQELRLGTAANGMSGPAVTGGARAVASCLIVHPEWGRERSSSPPRPPSFPEQPTRPRPGLASRPGTTARVAMTPLAAPRAIEILGLAQSVHEIRGGWEMLALQIEDRAPWTSRALRSCMAPSSWPTLGGEP